MSPRRRGGVRRAAGSDAPLAGSHRDSTHQRQREQGDVEGCILQRRMRHITGNHLLVDRHMVETVDRVAVMESSGNQCFAAPEVPDHEILALLRPADELLVGDHRPGLPGLTVQRVIVLPLLRVVLKSLMRDAASA